MITYSIETVHTVQWKITYKPDCKIFVLPHKCKDCYLVSDSEVRIKVYTISAHAKHMIYTVYGCVYLALNRVD